VVTAGEELSDSRRHFEAGGDNHGALSYIRGKKGEEKKNTGNLSGIMGVGAPEGIKLRKAAD